MSRVYFLKRAGALVVALATLISVPAYAAKKPAGAQLGVVTASGDLTSGGNLSYKFNVNVATNPGTLVVKVTSSGKKFRGKFPLLTLTDLPLGDNTDISGTSVRIPTNFVGTVVMRVTAKYNKKNIGKQTLTVTIGAPLPETATSATTNLYDVGFENPVTLDGSIVPTSGMSSPLTYTWSQTSGKIVTLATNGVVSTGFTTDALTNFVNMGTSLFVNDVDDVGNTNALYVTPEHRFSAALSTGNAEGLALDNEQATAATYGFKLLVSDGSTTRTGVFTVACSVQTPAQPNIPTGVTAFYKNAVNSTNWVLLAKPSGSTATLAHSDGLVAELRPDVEGIYIVQDQTLPRFVASITTLTNGIFTNNNTVVTNFTDSLNASITTYLTNSTTPTVTNTIDRWTIITNTAATWTGVAFCGICHGPNSNVGEADLVTPWSQTGHATMAQRGVDGILSSHYSEDCFQCHTVGFNKSPAAANGNFYAVQQQVGWQFPSVLQPGNYAAMPDELKNLANIQCENCHGPGSRHPGSPSISLDVKVCASCHQDGSHHVRPQQWEISPHAGAYENIAVSRGPNPQCARCHSPEGYMDVAKGTANVGTTDSVTTGTGPLTCQICHDPHDKFDNDDRHQLRVYDSALFGNPYFRSNTVTIALGESITTADPRLTNSNLVVTNLANAATCITCHNGRQLPMQTVIYGTNTVLSSGTRRPTTIGTSMYYQIGGPHDQTAGEAFLGVGMFDYGQVMGNSFHTHLAKCTTCHMYQLQTTDTITVDDVPVSLTNAAVYSQFVDVLGNHTFEMDYVYQDTNGVQHTADNIAACNQCHAGFFDPVDSFDFKASNAQDYDGNGTIEGVQTETQGMLNNLGFLLKTTGVTITTNSAGDVTSVSTSAGYSTNNVVLVEAQSKAAWNFLAVRREGSFGVHNTQYTTRLLQTTYTDLSTNYFADVTKTYQNVFTNAFLR